MKKVDSRICVKKNGIRIGFDFIIAIAIVCIFKEFILGNGYYIYNDIGSDTFHTYYPFYVNCAMRLREGNFSAWLWNEGLGTSILNFVYILDPFSLISIIFGAIFGPQCIQALLVWMQIVKILLVYILTRKYVSFFCKSEVAICLAALLNAFNGFLFLWGQHYFFGTACVWIMVMLVVIEKYLEDEKRVGIYLTIVVFLVILSNFYFGYMILLTSAVYYLFRFFQKNENTMVKDKINKLVKTFFYVITGVCLSGVLLIPVGYSTISNSSRLDGANAGILSRLGNDFISSFSAREIIERMCLMISNNMRYINDTYNSYYPNYYAGPQFFITIFIFYFLSQWLIWDYKKSKSEGNMKAFFCKSILLFLAISNSAVGLIYNVFVCVVYRYTFSIIPFLALAVALVWENVIEKNKVNAIGVIIGGILSASVCFFAFFNSSNEVHEYVIFTTGILAIVGLALLLYSLGFLKNKVVIHIFLILIIVTTVTDDYITTNKRSYVVSEEAMQWRDKQLENETVNALEWLKQYDKTFFRIEKTYADWHQVSDSRFENYSTLSAYNSTLNRNISDFLSNMYYESTPGDIPPLFLVPHFDSALENQLLNITNTKYILSKEELDQYDWCELVEQVGNVYIYKKIGTESIAKWYTSTITKDEFSALDDAEKNDVLFEKVISDDIWLQEKESTARIGDFVLSESDVKGKAFCDGTGLLLLAIPDQEGWHVYVDGVEAKTYNVDYGFIGVLLEKGEHNIVATYTIPKGKEGIYMSLIGVGLLVVGIWATKKRKRAERNCA